MTPLATLGDRGVAPTERAPHTPGNRVRIVDNDDLTWSKRGKMASSPVG